MNLSCNVIRDLLPLYVEELASTDTRALVEAHTAECESCREALEKMGRKPKTQLPSDVSALRQVKKGILRRRNLTGWLAFLAAATLLLGVFLYLTAPEYLSAQKAVAAVRELEDGSIVVDFREKVSRVSTERINIPADEGGGQGLILIAWNSRLDRILPGIHRQQSLNVSPQEICRIWYSSTGEEEEDTLLWGQKMSGGVITLPRLVLMYYFMISIGAAAVLTALSVALRKKKYGNLLTVPAMFFWCFAGAEWIGTGGQMVNYNISSLLSGILLLALLGTGMLYCAARVWALHRQDTRI